jgi:hypothetical protein
MDLEETVYDGVNWIHLAQNMVQSEMLVNTTVDLIWAP